MSWWNTALNIVSPITTSIFPNSGDKAKKELRGMENIFHQYYDPYAQMGQEITPELKEQYERLMNDPASQMALVGQGFQQSPGYEWQVNQMMNAGNNAAAAGGMLGTPAHQQQMMQGAGDIANQDFYKYLSNALGMQQQGLQGMQGLFNTGYGANTALAGNLANSKMNRAGLQQQIQQEKNSDLSSMISTAAAFLPYML